MTKQLTKRSKATYYKNRLDKAVDILKEVKEVSTNFEYIGVEQLFEFEDSINDINFKIDNLLEDIDDGN